MRLYGGVHMVDRPCMANVRRLDINCLPIVDMMHANGIRVDSAYFRSLDQKFSGEMDGLRDDIQLAMMSRGIFWDAFNPGSSDQVAELLFDKLSLKPPGGERMTRGRKRMTVDDDMMASLRPLAPELITPLDDYRTLVKLKGTYTSVIPEMVSDDDRLRTIFKATRTATGRLASGDKVQGYINLQNIPVRGEWGLSIRNGFIASPGCVLGSIDLSQIEMRWACHLSGCRAMAEVFINREDIHTKTAISLFKLDRDFILWLIARDITGKLTDEEKRILKTFRHTHRLPAKNLGFGVLYGLTAGGLQIKILSEGGPLLTIEECDDYIRLWFEAYPEIAEWMQLQYWRARRYGCVWDAFGRIRPIPGMLSAIPSTVSKSERDCGNMPVQSSAQGTIKLAMAELTPIVEYFQHYKTETCLPLLQVHDELIFELSIGIAAEFLAMGKEIMIDAAPLSIPVDSSADMAESWGKLK